VASGNLSEAAKAAVDEAAAPLIMVAIILKTSRLLGIWQYR
jgi:hypothetical protein